MVAAAAPEPARALLAVAAREATAAGIDAILLGGAVVAAIAALIAFVAIRREPAPAPDAQSAEDVKPDEHVAVRHLDRGRRMAVPTAFRCR